MAKTKPPMEAMSSVGATGIDAAREAYIADHLDDLPSEGADKGPCPCGSERGRGRVPDSNRWSCFGSHHAQCWGGRRTKTGGGFFGNTAELAAGEWSVRQALAYAFREAGVSEEAIDKSVSDVVAEGPRGLTRVLGDDFVNTSPRVDLFLRAGGYLHDEEPTAVLRKPAFTRYTLDEDLEPPPFVVKPMVPRGQHRALVAGPPKAGKSTVVMSMVFRGAP